MTGATRRVVLALGSNMGDRLANLQAGIDHLASAAGAGGSGGSPPERRSGGSSPRASTGMRLVAVSAVYETVPVGGPPQPDYLNAVLLADSDLPARSLLDRCQAAEQALGRVREERWGPRTLDVDLIACDDEVSGDPVLTLPHPRAHERAFVLAPWLDVDPAAHLVGFGPVADLLAKADLTGVTRLVGSALDVAQAQR